MTRAENDLVRQLYQPDVEAMRNSLPGLGESLHNAASELASDFTLARIDSMVSRLKSAQTNLVHLRKALVQEGVA
ncbi:MAG: hypothetical protein L3J22_05605 [Xanthomonadales bacterium]|nr:hypothetical protein [Xanthomonadales bacterium]